MRLDDLRVHPLTAHLQLDLLMERFREDEPGGGMDEFVRYLREHLVIDQSTFLALHTQERIDVSLPVEEGTEAEAMALLMGDHTFDELGQVGKGGMGTIHLVRERDLGRKVALKKMNADVAQNARLAAHFFQEVQITAQLAHPSIIPVYQVRTDDDSAPAYSMKLIQGKTLGVLMNAARRCHQDGRPLDEALDLQSLLEHFLKVCDAVGYAHTRGVVHRDLKPANIMIGPFNEVYVMDWGVARSSPAFASGQESDGDKLDEVAGTPAYMSPEQAQGDLCSLQPASDQYTLGLILFEIVCLKRANKADDPMDALAAAIAGERAPIVHVNPKVPVPREMQAIIEKATAYDPSQRYRTVQAFADDIRRYLANQEVVARPDRPLERAARWLAHNRGTALVIILSLVSLVFAGFLGFMIYEREARIAAQAREVALGELLTRVARQSHLVDEQFLRFEGLVQGLAGAAVQALQRGSPDLDEQWYLDQDYAVPAKGPADLRPAAHYHRDVSTAWTVFKLAPGVEAAAVAPILDRLAPLRHDFRSLMLRSLTEDASTWEPARKEAQLRDLGVPLVWSYVGFEEGIHQAFPGKSGYSATYDPRQRPWYRAALDTHGPHWGMPYMDAIGMGLILPCAMALYDADGRFRGVAGVELTLDHVIENFLVVPSTPGIRESYLLDQKGRIVIRSSQRGKPQESKGGDLELALFPQEDVVKAVTAMQSGYSEADGEILVYYRMNAVGWYFVVVGAAADLLAVP